MIWAGEWTVLLRWDPTRLLIAGFATAILAGGALLALPISGQVPVRFLDALFTATSAVCVTGLTVVDTGATYSSFGQAMVLLLFQAGGLGIMTLSTAFALMLGRRVSLTSHDAVRGSLGADFRHTMGGLLKRVVLWTVVIESAGALLLTLAELQRLPPLRALWFGVFHSISAFCNAGFSLRADSFMVDRTQTLVVSTLVTLIVLGGLGFAVLTEVGVRLRARLRQPRSAPLSLHSKLSLGVTGLLLLTGAAGFAVLEHGNALRDAALGERILASVFASVTARTAGFNTVDYARLTNATLYMTILLMVIGGSPGSTAGGIKTTTLGVILALARARFRGESCVRLFNRCVPEDAVAKSIALVTLAFTLVTVFVVGLTMTELGALPYPETRGRFMELFFESASAFGTVGLSMGATARLSDGGKVLIMLLMFIGRLGPLTISLAIAQRERRAEVRYAEEPVMIG
jgi:trk system potassium uptake protein TrkH